jgi:septum site-determining protein MinC
MVGRSLQLPKIRVRGRSFMALIIAPEYPLAGWFDALDQQIRVSADFFADRPVVADLGSVMAETPTREVAKAVLDGLAARQLRIVGVEGADPLLLSGTRWDQTPTVLHGREGRNLAVAPSADAAGAERAPIAVPAATPSLLIDRPVRSGQAITFEDGDIIVVGSVASGAEVMAGGSIHIYGALRGRAIAGLSAGETARIFCRRLEAEMVAVGGHYRTAEHWGAGLQGRAVQVLSDRGELRLSALD